MNIINRSSIPLMLLPVIVCCQPFAFGQGNSKSNADRAAAQKNSTDVHEAATSVHKTSLVLFGLGMQLGYSEGYQAAGKAFERQAVVKDKDEYKRRLNDEFETRSKLAFARQVGKLENKNSGFKDHPLVLEMVMKPFENGWEKGFWLASKEAKENIEAVRAGQMMNPPSAAIDKMDSEVELAVHEFAQHLGLTPGDAETAIEQIDHPPTSDTSSGKK